MTTTKIFVFEDEVNNILKIYEVKYLGECNHRGTKLLAFDGKASKAVLRRLAIKIGGANATVCSTSRKRDEPLVKKVQENYLYSMTPTELPILVAHSTGAALYNVIPVQRVSQLAHLSAKEVHNLRSRMSKMSLEDALKLFNENKLN